MKWTNHFRFPAAAMFYIAQKCHVKQAAYISKNCDHIKATRMSLQHQKFAPPPCSCCMWQETGNANVQYSLLARCL